MCCHKLQGLKCARCCRRYQVQQTTTRGGARHSHCDGGHLHHLWGLCPHCPAYHSGLMAACIASVTSVSALSSGTTVIFCSASHGVLDLVF